MALFQLTQTPRSGLSLSSIQAIQPGTLVLQDKPLFTLSIHARSDHDVHQAVRALDRDALQQFLQLSNWRQGDRFVGILKTNALPAGPNESAIFPLASRLNHSCLPNCEVTFSPSSQTLLVHAIHPIPPSEELTISYLSTKLLLPARERQVHLLTSFGFTCACRACTPPASLAHDARRADITALKVSVDQEFPTSAEKAYGGAKRLVEVCREEGLKVEEAFGWATLAQVMIMWGGAGGEECESVVREAVRAFEIVRGQDGEDAKRWRRWVGKTGDHPRNAVLGSWDFPPSAL